MILLLIFAFIAGIVTILSPCILPILPIILSGSVGGGKRKPLGIVTGFVLSFTFFTLFLSALVRASGISADSLRVFSIFVIFIFGLSLLLPRVQQIFEVFFSKFSSLTPNNAQSTGFAGGILIGLSLGLLWTPCVGPILASVITLALTGSVNATAFLITLAYSLGTAIPMLVITYSGRTLFEKVPWLLANTKSIQQMFGVIMMLIALALFFDIDRKFQIWVLDKFPAYGVGLTKFEDNKFIKKQLDRLTGDEDEIQTGLPLFQMLADSSLGKAPEIQPDGEWINSPPTSLAENKGKVVLVDFWTYSCINCIRTIPYLNNWHDKYQDDGLVIIGVHAPEFEFEKNIENVKRAVDDFEIKYPVVQDNEFRTWRAYKNRYWPAKYLIDRKGEIRYQHFGEGKYDETEQAIQYLLKETGAEIDEQIDNPDYRLRTRTPELYLGFQRMDYLASPEKVLENQKQSFSKPNILPNNQFAFQGDWVVHQEFANPQEGSTFTLEFDAQEVYIVARAKELGMAGKINIYLDNQLVKQTDSGSDVDNGQVTINQDRLYRILNLSEPGRHTLEFRFEDSNVEIYTFTFG